MRYAKTFGLVYAVLALAIFVFCAPSHASAERVGENSDFHNILNGPQQAPRR